MNESDPFLQRALKNFQDNVSRSGPVAVASYSLIGAILLLGGIGYALDYWLQVASHGFLLGGLLLGILIGFYELAKTVWPGK